MDGQQKLLREGEYLQNVCTTVKDLAEHNEKCANCRWFKYCCGGCRAFAAVNNPADYLAADKVTCKIFKEHWDEKLYTVADQYFTRRTRKAAEGEDQPEGC